MANKKLTKTEIRVLAGKILREANEIISKNNEAALNSKKYLNEKAAIESRFNMFEAKRKLQKELKIILGKQAEEFEFDLYPKYNTKSSEIQERINVELRELKERFIKKPLNSYISNYNNDLLLIEEEITIAQIDKTDINLLMNSIKMKLVS